MQTFSPGAMKSHPSVFDFSTAAFTSAGTAQREGWGAAVRALIFGRLIPLTTIPIPGTGFPILSVRVSFGAPQFLTRRFPAPFRGTLSLTTPPLPTT